MENYTINIPQNIKIIVWFKKKRKKCINILIYNKTKHYKLYIDLNSYNNRFNIDTNTNSIIMNRNFVNNDNNKLLKFFFKFIKSWDMFFFKKIKFKGKGFRMRFFKKNKFVKFFFGKSHKTFIFFKKIIMKKINKYKFILKSINNINLNLNASKVIKIKPLNLYTLRGLRISKQIVFKRKGKKGTYI